MWHLKAASSHLKYNIEKRKDNKCSFGCKHHAGLSSDYKIHENTEKRTTDSITTESAESTERLYFYKLVLSSEMRKTRLLTLKQYKSY